MSSELNWCVRLIFMWPAAIHSLTPEVCSTDGKKVEQTAKKGKGKTTTWIDTRDWGLIAMDWWVCMSIISWVASVQWLCKYFSVWQRVIRCWCTSDKHPIPPTIIPVHVFIPHWPWRFQHNTISDGNCELFFRTEQATHKLGPNFWWNNIRRVFVTS